MMKRVSSFKSYREFPQNRKETCVLKQVRNHTRSRDGRSMGMLRGMDGEGLKMASEQRTDYGTDVRYRLRWVRPL